MQFERITVNPQQMNGLPCIRGLRIPVATVIDMVAAGMNETEGLVSVKVLLTEEQLAWAVRKSDPELLESVNGALEKLQREGRTTAIIKRWIPLYK